MSYIRNHIGRLTVLAVLLTLTGVYGYYYVCELAAKWAFAHQTYFADDELILIAVPNADLTPETANLLSQGEFLWHGEMVDALHREVRSDTLFVYGFRDRAETKLRQEAAWLYLDTTRKTTDTRPPYRTKLYWETTLNAQYQASFAPVRPGNFSPSRATFAYVAHCSTGPHTNVPHPPPNH